MTTTVTVTISARKITGDALPRARVHFELTKADVDAGIVVPMETTVTLDADGNGTSTLFSNTAGTQGSQTRVTIYDENGKLQFKGKATIPETACDLHDVLDLQSSSVTDAQAAVLTARDWAIKTSGPVSGTDYSAKYHADAAADSAAAAAASEAATAADAVQTAADRAQTGLDRVATGDDRTAAASSASAAAGSATTAQNAATEAQTAIPPVQAVDYSALRAYNGNATTIQVTGYLATSAPSGIAGLFTRDDSDTTSADNGGTIIVASNGKRWKRVVSDGRINIKWFGAKGDNANNDTSAFAAAGAYLRSIGGGTLLLPLGDYLIDDPFWSYGINRWELIGYGATVRNISSSSYAFQKLAFNLNFPAEAGGTPPAWDSLDSGTLIQTVDRGSSSVTCVTASDASKFTVGKIYKITSRCTQAGGWPQNHAHLDFVTVTAVDATTGVISFKENLKFKHRSNDIEATNYTGAARIWSGNSARGTDFTELFVCRGVKFLDHASFSTSGGSFYGVKKLVLEDCRFKYMYLGECENATVRNCDVSIFEPDKHIHTLLIEGGRIDYLTQATGVQNLTVEGAVINRCSTLGPRVLRMSGNFISDKSEGGLGSTPAIVIIMDGYAPKSAAFIGNTFSSTRTYTSSADKAGAVKCPRSGVTVASADYTLTASSIQINKAGANALSLLAAVTDGTFIEFVSANSFAKVLDVYDDGTYYVIDVEYTASTTGHTAIRAGYMGSLLMKGNEYSRCNYRYLETIRAIHEEVEDQCGTNFYTVTYNSGLLRTNASNTPEGRAYLQLMGYVTQVEINVIRAYTGPDAALYAGAVAIGKYVDLKQAGLRVFTASGSYGTKAGDDTGAITPSFATQASNVINQSKASAGAVTPAGTLDQQAIVQFTYRIASRSRTLTEV